MFTIQIYASSTEPKYEYTQELHNIALLQQRLTALIRSYETAYFT